jgi:AsmA protein
MNFVKVGLYVLIGLVVALGAAIAAIAFGLDADKYKPELISAVKTRTGRTLSIEDPLRLSVFPKLGITVGKVRLSDLEGSKTFATVGEIRASLAILPLLSKQVVIDRVVLSGVSVDLIRYKDGRTNFDDLLSGGNAAKDPSGGVGSSSFKIDIEGVEVSADSLGWTDEKAGTRIRMSALKMATGRIADDVPGKLTLGARVQGEVPKVDALISLSSGYRFSIERKAIELSGVDLKINGDVPGAAGLTAVLKGSVESDPGRKIFKAKGIDLSIVTKDGIEAKLVMPGMEYSPEKIAGEKVTGLLKLVRNGLSLDARLALAAVQSGAGFGKNGSPAEAVPVLRFPEFAIDLSGKQADTTFQGKLTSALIMRMQEETLQMVDLKGEVNVNGPGIPQKAIKALMAGQIDAAWGRQSVSGNVTTRIDDSTIKTKFDVKDDVRPTIGFDVDIDQINIDRFAAKSSGAGGGTTTPSPIGAMPAGPEQPLDFSALKSLNLHGQVRAGRITTSNVKLEKLNATINVSGGRLDVAPLSAALYGGSLTGSASVNASGNRLSLRQQLLGVNIGPLLKDVAGQDFIEGRGNVTLDLETQGPTASSLKKALGGAAAVNLKDGAVKGINLAEAFRNAKALLGAKSAHEQGASATDKTDFAELVASFRIHNGVAHNDDLSLKSPFVRLGGGGDIDIGNNCMDYLAKASIVATSGGQGGKNADDLRGLTIPVRLAGPFDALKYRVDFGAVATEAVKQQVQERVKDQLQDRLKGLLKR